MNKLNIIANDSVMWGDNQIGFFVDSKTVELCVSDEDFDNNEIGSLDQREILVNLPQIESDLRNCGYTVTRS